MKKTKYLCFAVILLIAFGCKPGSVEKKTDKVFLSKNIEYDVTINNFLLYHDMTLDEAGPLWFRDNIEASSRIAFIDLMFKNALKGKLALTDMNGKSIDTNRLKELLSFTDTVSLTRLTPPFYTYDTVITSMISKSNITSLRFRENWLYNPVNMAITKEVTAMAPVFSFIRADDQGKESVSCNKTLFWIKLPEKSNSFHILTKRIMYHVTVEKPANSNVLNSDTVALASYINKLNDLVFSDSLKAYVWGGNDLADVLKKGKELKNDYNNMKISSLRFIEEWGFDPESMSLNKNVIGVCPVVAVFYENNDLKGYRPLYFVYFSDVWMPFGEKLALK